ncbi:MAG: P-loop NTPase [Nitrososphaeria archaeon]|jgi:ATP-binding protein involved in chromosome partitioning
MSEKDQQDRDLVLKFLSGVKDPALKKDIISLGFVKDLQVDGKQIKIKLSLTSPGCPHKDEILSDIVRSLEGYSVIIEVTHNVLSGSFVRKEGTRKVKNIIAVGSGKGGVGKSTVSILLAYALKKLGAKVGIIDLDFYGATIPSMLGSSFVQEVNESGLLIPPLHQGIKIISLAYFVPQNSSVIWRGPMLSKAVHDFMEKVDWGELDYLIADLPPGTGDVPITLGQDRLINAAIIVSTPQPAAVNVALKLIDTFKKLNVPVLGGLENMSYFICPNSKEKVELFGSRYFKEKLEEIGLPYLGALPFVPQLRELEDVGVKEENISYIIDDIIPVAQELTCRLSVLNSQISERPFFLNIPKKK